MKRVMRMKKLVFILTAFSLLLCGCGKNNPPMEELPPEQSRPKTSSTYTGTTVEFYYVPTASTPRRPTNELEMPDFDTADIADPFDDSFYAMFTDENAVTETVTFPGTDALTVPSAETALFSDNEAVTAPPSESADVRVTETGETAVNGALERVTETAAETDNANVYTYRTRAETSAERDSKPSETAYESDNGDMTYPTSESYNIGDYIPRENDFPDFSAIDINNLLQ